MPDSTSTSAVEALRACVKALEPHAPVPGFHYGPWATQREAGVAIELATSAIAALEQGEGESTLNRNRELVKEIGREVLTGRASIPAPGASWTEEQIERAWNAARDAVVEVLARHGYDLPGIADLCGIAATRAALASLNATPGAQITAQVAETAWDAYWSAGGTEEAEAWQAVGEAVVTLPAPTAEQLAWLTEKVKHKPVDLNVVIGGPRAPPAQAHVGGVGAGWKLVPREPTPDMVEACDKALHNWRESLSSDERMLRHAFRNGKPFHSATVEEKHTLRWYAMYDAAPDAAQPEAAEMPVREELAHRIADLVAAPRLVPGLGRLDRDQLTELHTHTVSSVLALLSPSAKES